MVVSTSCVNHARPANARWSGATAIPDRDRQIVTPPTDSTNRNCSYLKCPCYALVGMRLVHLLVYHPLLTPLYLVNRMSPVVSAAELELSGTSTPSEYIEHV